MMLRGNTLDSYDPAELVYTNKLIVSRKYVDFEWLHLGCKVHERRQNPLGHAPDHLVIDEVSRKGALQAAQGQRDLAANARLSESTIM